MQAEDIHTKMAGATAERARQWNVSPHRNKKNNPNRQGGRQQQQHGDTQEDSSVPHLIHHPAGTQVKVLMVKDMKSGDWRRVDQYSDGSSASARSSPRSALTSRSGRSNANDNAAYPPIVHQLTTRSTWGAQERQSNKKIPFPNHLPPVKSSEADKKIFSSFTKTHASTVQARGGGGAARDESPARRQHLEKQQSVASARFVAPPSHAKPKGTSPSETPRAQLRHQKQQQQQVTAKVVGMLDTFESKRDLHYRGSVLDGATAGGGTLPLDSSLVFDPVVVRQPGGGSSSHVHGGHHHRRGGGARSTSPGNNKRGPSQPRGPVVAPSYSGLRRGQQQPVLVHPLVGLLCNLSPPQIVGAYRQFCQTHMMPSLLGGGSWNGGGALQHLSPGSLAFHGSAAFEYSLEGPPAGLPSPQSYGGGGGGDLSSPTRINNGSFGAPQSPLNLSTATGAPSPSGGVMSDIAKRMENGFYFYVHPDGMSSQQFRQFLPHLSNEVGGGVEIGKEFATSMFRALCRDSTHKLPFSDILKLVSDHLLTAEVHKNLEFIFKAFDPYGTQRVPNHLFTASFFRKFIYQTPSPIPSASHPQWLLLLEALEALENPRPPPVVCSERSSVAGGTGHGGAGGAASLRSMMCRQGSVSLPASSPRGDAGGPKKNFLRSGAGAAPPAPPVASRLLDPQRGGKQQQQQRFDVDEAEAEHFRWLKTVYLNPANNYKTFTEKMNLLLSTMRAKQAQYVANNVRQTGSTDGGVPFGQIPMTGGDLSGSGLAAGGGLSVGGGGLSSLYDVPKKVPTLPLTYQEATVLFLGTPALYRVIVKNNFIFYPEEATSGSGAQRIHAAGGGHPPELVTAKPAAALTGGGANQRSITRSPSSKRNSLEDGHHSDDDGEGGTHHHHRQQQQQQLTPTPPLGNPPQPLPTIGVNSR